MLTDALFVLVVFTGSSETLRGRTVQVICSEQRTIEGVEYISGMCVLMNSALSRRSCSHFQCRNTTWGKERRRREAGKDEEQTADSNLSEREFRALSEQTREQVGHARCCCFARLLSL